MHYTLSTRFLILLPLRRTGRILPASRTFAGMHPLLVLCLLLSYNFVEAADDAYDQEFDPSIAELEKGGYQDPSIDQPTLKPIVLENFRVVPVIPVQLSTPTPKGPDEVGSIEGLPRDVRMRNDRQLDEENSNQAMDQMTDQLAPMMHDDTSVIGRGMGVGYYQEASIIETVPTKSNKTNRALVDATLDTTTTAAPTTASALPKGWMGIFIILLIALLLIAIIASLIYICCCHQDEVVHKETVVVPVTTVAQPAAQPVTRVTSTPVQVIQQPVERIVTQPVTTVTSTPVQMVTQQERIVTQLPVLHQQRQRQRSQTFIVKMPSG